MTGNNSRRRNCDYPLPRCRTLKSLFLESVNLCPNLANLSKLPIAHSHSLMTLPHLFIWNSILVVLAVGVEKSCTNNRLILAQEQMRQTTGSVKF